MTPFTWHFANLPSGKWVPQKIPKYPCQSIDQESLESFGRRSRYHPLLSHRRRRRLLDVTRRHWSSTTAALVVLDGGGYIPARRGVSLSCSSPRAHRVRVTSRRRRPSRFAPLPATACPPAARRRPPPPLTFCAAAAPRLPVRRRRICCSWPFVPAACVPVRAATAAARCRAWQAGIRGAAGQQRPGAKQQQAVDDTERNKPQWHST